MSIHGSFPSSNFPNNGNTNSIDGGFAEAKTSKLSSISSVSELKMEELRGEKITMGDEQTIKAIERALKALQGKTTSLEFSVHESTKVIAVKVKDVDTGEIIREIPPEKTLDLVAKLCEVAGIFVDEKR